MPANCDYSSPGFSFARQLQLNTKPNMQRRMTTSLVSPRFIELRPIVAVGDCRCATGFKMTASVAMGCNLVKRIP
jgi:hypothetical protein